jgi:hypothetical protein
LTSDELFYIGQALEFRIATSKQEVGNYSIGSSDYTRCIFIVEICERSLIKVHNLLDLANSTKNKAVTLKG